MMGIRRLTLVWGACCAVAHAFPGAPPFAPPGIVPPGLVRPIQNTTALPTPTYTNSSCSASCTVELPAWSALSWIHTNQLEYTETITAATKIYEIDTKLNYTLTRTQWNPLPKGYTVQALATNAEGTVYASHYVPDSTGFKSYTELVYPTPYFDYTDSYAWSGVLPTADNTKTSCETALAPDTKVLSEHPQYPQPTGGRPNLSAPGGTDYTLIWVAPSKDPDHSFFRTAFPTISAFASCTPSPTTPPDTPSRITTVLYITETSTAHTTLSQVPIIHTEITVSGFESTSTVRVTAPALVIIESSVTGFESQSYAAPAPTVHLENSVTGGFDEPSAAPGSYLDPASTVHLENSVTGGFDEPSRGAGPRPAGPTLTRGAVQDGVPSSVPGDRPAQAPGVADILLNVLTNSAFMSAVRAAGSQSAAAAFASAVSAAGGGSPSNAASNANPAPTPIFTGIQTTIAGKQTVVPGYILPGGSTATVGQTVTINGATTVLTAPSTPVLTTVPTTVAGVVMSVPVYVLPDGRTATVGQTVTVRGSTTVLASPTPSRSGVAGDQGFRGPEKTSAGAAASSSTSPNGGVRKVDGRWGAILAVVGVVGISLGGML